MMTDKNILQDRDEDIYTPQEVGYQFCNTLREYGQNIESHFFKLLCFYYFDIHLKKNINDLHALETEDIYASMKIWKNDIIHLLGNYLLSASKKEGISPEEIKDIVRVFTQNIINIFHDNEKLPKFCHNIAAKLKKDWNRLYTTLTIKDQLTRILSLNSYSTIYSYVQKNTNLQGHQASTSIVDPWSFQKANISAKDTLYYFFGLDTYNNISDIIQHQDILKNILLQNEKRNSIIIGSHTHKDFVVKEIINNQKDTEVIIDYMDSEIISSNMHTLLHETFGYYIKYIVTNEDEITIQEGSDMQGIIQNITKKHRYKNEVEYIYDAISDLSECVQQKIKSDKQEKVSIEDFLSYIGTITGNNKATDVFKKLFDTHSDITISLGENNIYTIQYKGRSISIQYTPKTVHILYQNMDKVIGEQKIFILPGNDIIISKYDIPQETKKLQKWARKYYIEDYIVDTSRVSIDEYLLELQDFVNNRGETHIGIEQNNGYIKYLLEHCFSGDTKVLGDNDILSFRSWALDKITIQKIQDSAYTKYIEWLYKTYKKGIYSNQERGKNATLSLSLEKKLRAKKKQVFLDALKSIGVSSVNKNLFKKVLHSQRGKIIEETQNAISFVISEQRAAPAISSYESKQKMSLEDLIDFLILEKIEFGEKTTDITKVYELCQKYDLLTYMHNSFSLSPLQEKILSKLNTYAMYGLDKHNHTRTSTDNSMYTEIFFLKQPRNIAEKAGNIIYKNIFEQHDNNISLRLFSMQKAIIEGDEKTFTKNKIIYEGYIKKLIQDIETEYSALSEIDGYNDITLQALGKVNKIKNLIPAWISKEKSEKDIIILDMKISICNAKNHLLDNNMVAFQGEKEKYDLLIANLKKVLENNLIEVTDDKQATNTIKTKNGKKKSKKNAYILQIERRIKRYKEAFPNEKDIYFSFGNNILKKHFQKIISYSLKAIPALKNKNITLYKEMQNNFHKSISEYEGEIKDKYSNIVEENIIHNHIRGKLNRIKALFPIGADNQSDLDKEGSVLKNSLRKYAYEAFSYIIYNKVEKYQITKSMFQKTLDEFEVLLLGKTSLKKIDRENIIQSYKNKFPTEKRLGISHDRNYDEKGFHAHLLEIELSRMSQNAQDIFLEKKPIGISSINEKAFLHTINFLKESLDKAPYIDDIYASFVLGNTGKYKNKISVPQGEKYIKNHFSQIVNILVQEHMVEDFLENYIQINNDIIKKDFIAKLYESIKLHIGSQYSKDRYNKSTYAYYLLHTVIGEKVSKKHDVLGSMKVKLPLLPEKKIETPEDIEYDNI